MKKNKQKNKKAANQQLRIMVLQNGFPLGEYCQPLNRPKRITIGSSATATISVPFYPLPNRLEIFRINRQGKIAATLNGDWSAEVISEKSIDFFQPEEQKHFDVKFNDQVTLFSKDIQVFAILEKLPLTAKKSRKVKLKPGLGSLFFAGPQEKKSFGWSVAFSAIALAAFMFGFHQIEQTPPESFEDLGDRYVTTFVHPDHFETIHEALLGNIESAQLVRSTIDYVDSFTEMQMGYPIQQPELMHPNSIKTYASASEKQTEDISSKLSFRRKIEDNDTESGSILISSVWGESFKERLFRLTDKISIMHDSHRLSKKLRGKTQKEFRKDPKYEMKNFRAVNIYNQLEIANIEGITPFNSLSNHQNLQNEIQRLTHMSKARRVSLLEKQEPDPVILSDKYLATITIDPKSSFFAEFYNLNEAIDPRGIDGLKGSRFNGESDSFMIEKKVSKIKRGKIDYELVERVVKRHMVEVKNCYEIALRRRTDLKGSAKFQWKINKKGRAESLKLENTDISDSKMLSCMKRQILAWQFPRAKHAKVDYSYAFKFKPQ